MSEDLFYNNVNYVIKLVKRLNYHFCDQEDLIQAGLMGLYEATKHYDTNKKVLFTTYATYYIVGAIKKEMRNCRLIKFSKEMYRLFRKLKTIDTNKSLETLSEDLQTSKENIMLALSYQEKIISLNQGPNDLELIDTISDKKPKIDDDLIFHLDRLSQEIILLRYYKGYTQSEIAKMLNLTQTKVSRLEKLALSKIKKNEPLA